MTMQLTWFVGVDWGSRAHQACILDGAGAVRGERAFKHGGEGLAAMAAWIDDAAGDAPAETVGVAIETPRGPVAESLLVHGFAVHSLNPKQLDRFRDRHSPAGAKDDRRDARVLASALCTDAPAFHRVEAADPRIVELREWSRIADELKREHRQLANRLGEQLWRYYPQFHEAVGDPAAPWALALWKRVPNPAAARGVRVTSYDKILDKHRIRRVDGATLKNRLQQRALDIDPAAARAAETHVRLLAKRLAVVNDQIAEAKTQLEAYLDRLGNADPEPGADAEPSSGQAEEQCDVAILRSLPGVGTVVTATLFAEANDALRRRDYHALRCLCGVAPVTRQSGKSRIVTRRLAAHGRLRNAAYHWARVAAQHDPVCKARYEALRESAATATPARCVPSPTASSTSPAPCCATARCSTGRPPRGEPAHRRHRADTSSKSRS